ncbi:MAG: VRR-NUC domain-containing protein [Prevotellaceae bacterium]|nr:VRR-NUC domain-containing protein [Prevotellaceae bacterium]
MRHVESRIQIACVRWFRLQFPDLSRNFFSVPNGGARLKTEGAIMKAEGTLAGVSDLLLLCPAKGWHGLCVEMKTAKGRQQPSQRQFQLAVERQGYKYVICRSFDDFKSEIMSYLG